MILISLLLFTICHALLPKPTPIPVPSLFFNGKVNSTTAFRILSSLPLKLTHPPPSWNRYYTSWYTLTHPVLPTLQQSRYRVLLSSVRKHVGDGIGHMYFMYNFELLLAVRLNLTFSHRHSLYQSLTKRDPFAVDKFFGWGKSEVPREAIWSECVLSYSYNAGGSRCTVCEDVRGGRFRRVVMLPEFLVYNCTSKFGWGEQCDQLAHQVLTQHNESQTVFQIPPGACDYEGTNTNVTETGTWFYHKYWKEHGRKESWDPEKSLKRIRFDPAKLNIAVHIRRGDFFREAKRRMLADHVFARTVADIVDMICKVDGPFSRTEPVVHIYSEGKKISDRKVSAHDVDGMEHDYYDEEGRVRTGKDWERLIKGMKVQKEKCERMRQKVKVQMHVSEDTLQNMHEMIAADVFVGSDSSMSLGPVYMLSRGVKVLVTNALRGGDLLWSKFDPKRGGVDGGFGQAWSIYEAANAASLLKSRKSHPVSAWEI